jgi:hypothetical protein
LEAELKESIAAFLPRDDIYDHSNDKKSPAELDHLWTTVKYLFCMADRCHTWAAHEAD